MGHTAGGEIEQIQFLLGHASVQTAERYIGCKQKLGQAVTTALNFVWTLIEPQFGQRAVVNCDCGSHARKTG